MNVAFWSAFEGMFEGITDDLISDKTDRDNCIYVKRDWLYVGRKFMLSWIL